MRRTLRHLATRLRHYGVSLAWQALMITTAFIGYCVASALQGRMATVAWFVAIYVAAGLIIQGTKEVCLWRRAISEQD